MPRLTGPVCCRPPVTPCASLAACASSADVAAVDGGFDAHNIPYDVLWLDIEHTNGEASTGPQLADNLFMSAAMLAAIAVCCVGGHAHACCAFSFLLRASPVGCPSPLAG